MLNTKELKLVVSTLSQRRAWIKKNLDDANLDAATRNESLESLKLLDSAIQKLAASSTLSNPVSAPIAAQPARPLSKEKEPVKQGVAIQDARVLVAEDNEDSAVLLMDILADLGIRFLDQAKDGIEAFEKIKRAELPFHIILCDWDMPALSGLEVHNKAKASNTLRGSHFIMVTAVSEAPKIKQAVQQGVNDYIVKPIDIDKLEAKITAALAASSIQ